MVTRVTIGHDGQAHEETLPKAGGVVSSRDFQHDGLEVHRGMGTTPIASPDQLLDTDVITINGVEMTASMARSLGIVEQAFPGTLATPTTPQEPAEVHAEGDPQPTTGHAEFDEVVAGLNESVEAGSISYEEARAFETAVGEVALAGLSIEHAVETLEGFNDGTVDPNAVPADIRNNLQAAEAKITSAATASAQQELGAETFGFLQQASAVHPAVDAVIRQYALDRATGQTDLTWTDMAQHIQRELTGG